MFVCVLNEPYLPMRVPGILLLSSSLLIAYVDAQYDLICDIVFNIVLSLGGNIFGAFGWNLSVYQQPHTQNQIKIVCLVHTM